MTYSTSDMSTDAINNFFQKASGGLNSVGSNIVGLNYENASTFFANLVKDVDPEVAAKRSALSWLNALVSQSVQINSPFQATQGNILIQNIQIPMRISGLNINGGKGR